ncbi:MAG TPA: serine hydrolase domain-containing protein [Gaiellaceae bacterium]
MRIALAIAVAGLTACASHPSAAPAQKGRLGAVATALTRMADAGRLSGTVLVAKDGRPVLTRAYGLANRRSGELNRTGTRFNLASVGKTFTAVAVARLVQEEKLRFDDPVGRYVPELPRRLGDRITVAELLDHTSGLGDFFASPDYERLRSSLTSLDRYLPLIVGEPTVAPPGGGFHYSNSGYLLLGLVVERVSGRAYYDFLRREVFDRAGMTRTGCTRSDKLGRGTAIGYARDAGGFQAMTSTLPPRGTSAGGCYSTTGDLLAFANALLDHRLLNPRLTKIVTTPKVAVGPSEKYGYGFGLRYGRPGEPPTIWHNGGSPGAGAEIDLNPALGYTVVVLSNFSYPAIRPAIDLILSRLRIP